MRLLIALLLCTSPAALAGRPFTPEELLATKRLDDPQISPDGKLVAFTVRQKSLELNRDVKDVWIVPFQGGAPRQFTRDGRSEHPRWSPDGKKLLIVSQRAGQDQAQLWLYDLASGGDPQQVTSLIFGADLGTFSPDGKWIAYTSEVHPGCSGTTAEVDACVKKRVEEQQASKVSARIVDHLFARHWTEWKEGKRAHVFVQPAAGGPARDLTPGDSDWPTWRLGGADDLAFTTDGKEIIVSAKPAQREAWSTNGDLWAIPVPGGGAPKNLTADNPGDDARPRPSPDGRYLAWLSQARDGYESDQWKLKLRDLKSGRVSVIGDFDDDVGTFVWRRDSSGIVASVLQKGRFYLNTVSLDGKVARFSDAATGDDFDVAPDGSVAVVVSGMARPPELATQARGAAPKAVTRFNADQYAGIDMPPAPTDLWVDGKDGSKVHSFVLKPPGLSGRAPLLLLIHGGPQGAWEDQWGMRWNEAAFAAQGYVVLTVNPHGSTGYGHAFEEEISRDWGGLAYDDILRSVDAAEKLPFVEPGRTCAAGASYGGYMIDWIAGHTDRFRCLVSHDGVYDIAAMYGSTEELWFPEWEMGGPPWEVPETYRKWSPSTYVKNFKTPTLVVQGELDFRVPVEQGLGMFTALQRQGVESRLLYFPDEGHWVLKPRNSLLWYRTVFDWIRSHSAQGKQANR
ncbi:MAG: prolyl oligopeptidase family serine peptidase [Myxococcales bacterium]